MSEQPPRPAAHTCGRDTGVAIRSGETSWGREGRDKDKKQWLLETSQAEAGQGRERGKGPAMSKVEGMEPWGTNVRPRGSEEKSISSNR